MDVPELDGSRLASRLRELPVGSRHVTLIWTGRAWQAAMKVEAGYRTDVRDDPVNALLVATGAVSVLEMNRRDRERALDDDDLDLIG